MQKIGIRNRINKKYSKGSYKMKKTAAALLLCLGLTACSPIEDGAVPAGGDIETTLSVQTEDTSVSETSFTKISENSEMPETSEETTISQTESETSEITEETTISESKTELEISEKLPESITLSTYSVELTVGGKKMPIVTMLPEDCSDKSEIWESDDTSVAKVDGYGNITGISEGSCTVTVKAAANTQVTAEVKVTVTAAPQTHGEPTYIDGILIANKTYALPADYAPGVQPEAEAAFKEMQSAAWNEGLNIWIASGYRSYEYQSGLYERYVNRSGKAEADRYSARPGHSEHQTGLAFDLNSIDDSFADTAEGKWVAEHCHEYGFIIRYPKGAEDITGYIYEPWHIRYLGKEIAEKVYNSGLTLEEYLGITSVYAE